MTNPSNRATLEAALAEIGSRAHAQHKIVEIAVYGGTALLLTLESRVATKGLDAVILNDHAWLRATAKDIATERGWPEDWLNDGVKGFLSVQDGAAHARTLFRTYPSEASPGLRVFLAAPPYLFAMKCLAMRLGGTEPTQDRNDIEMLARVLGIATSQQALEVLARYYPASRISPKTQFGIEEIFGA